jgi:cell division transport system permease protein
MLQLQRLFKTALKRIQRNPYNSLGAVMVLFLTFFVGGILTLTSLASNIAIRWYETRPQVTAFLKDDTTLEQVEAIKNNVSKISSVTNVKHVTKEDALKIYQERYSEDPALLDFVTADILPASIEVQGSNIDKFGEIANQLKTEAQVYDVTYSKEIVDRLARITNAVRIAGIIVVAFLFLTSVTVTLIVVGLNISLHKEEIEIMKLVGATKAYVRSPFIIEGIIYGFVSALLAVGILAAFYPFILGAISDQFNPIPINIDALGVFGGILLVEMVVGFLIGSLGAWVATRRYLEV